MNLETWLRDQPNDQFPSGELNKTRYALIASTFNSLIHPSITPLANAMNRGVLTDHGPEHIRRVIQRASELCSPANFLSPYETYLLLIAIHLHDVGNRYGRDLHELMSWDELRDMGPLAGEDVEKRVIWKIAQAHGGRTISGSKDKIGELIDEPIYSRDVRVQLLASILRFADELADDSTRAVNNISSIQENCRIYHHYAHALHSVIVDKMGKEIQLHFTLDEESSTPLFVLEGDGTTRSVHLYEYILMRCWKMFLELRYCMRFMREHVSINRIKVKIKFMEKNGYEELHDPIGFTLEERGYLDDPYVGIFQMCGSDLEYHGVRLSGEQIAQEITQRIEELIMERGTE